MRGHGDRAVRMVQLEELADAEQVPQWGSTYGRISRARGEMLLERRVRVRWRKV